MWVRPACYLVGDLALPILSALICQHLYSRVTDVGLEEKQRRK